MAVAGVVAGAAGALVMRRRGVTPVAPAPPGLESALAAAPPDVRVLHGQASGPAKAVSDAYRDARRAFGRWRLEPSDDTLAELDERCKTLWHTASLAEPFLDGAPKELARASRVILSLLHEHRELDELANAARAQPVLLGREGAPRFDAFVERRHERLERRILEAGREAYGRKPARLTFAPR